MRKVIFSVMMLAGSTLGFTSTASAQAVEQGNVLIDTYYGFPNLYTAVFKAAYTEVGSPDGVTVKGMGPLGLRGEYMVADKIGIGLDIGMNNTVVEYTDQDYTYDEDGFIIYGTDGEPVMATYDYQFKTQKIGVMATFNFHFLDNDKVDAYVGVGAGYGNRSFSYKTNDPNYTDEDASFSVPFPVASRLGVGMRYFFTDNIGANLNIGIGQGGIINAGISAKF